MTTAADLAASLQDKVGKNWDTDTMTCQATLATGIQSTIELAGFEFQLWDSGTYPADFGQRSDRIVVNTDNQTAEITAIAVG
ncbi:hypothetical protein DYI24_21860 [Rhodopseudomonas sp. BR0C11]|uniref:hypothetical protein n=1 Tax=Rhodopseudomonas sp. BR0C11 TaxID=2269370 RepID=UPI0013DF35AC|nr:hypothetical protein [Rhodopseudomonas sp. BR0C11]NEV79683.1 hypothetical protein [Rhodopseudomonas sp. BR0C11]